MCTNGQCMICSAPQHKLYEPTLASQLQYFICQHPPAGSRFFSSAHGEQTYGASAGWSVGRIPTPPRGDTRTCTFPTFPAIQRPASVRYIGPLRAVTYSARVRAMTAYHQPTNHYYCRFGAPHYYCRTTTTTVATARYRTTNRHDSSANAPTAAAHRRSRAGRRDARHARDSTPDRSASAPAAAALPRSRRFPRGRTLIPARLITVTKLALSGTSHLHLHTLTPDIIVPPPAPAPPRGGGSGHGRPTTRARAICPRPQRL